MFNIFWGLNFCVDNIEFKQACAFIATVEMKCKWKQTLNIILIMPFTPRVVKLGVSTKS